MDFANYAYELIKDIPSDVFEGLASIICIGVVAFIAWKGWKTGLRYSAALLLLEYIFLLFCSTVIFRVASQSRTYDFHPLWSYKAIQDGRVELLSENIMNVIVFIPIGLLLGCAFKQTTWWKALLIGCSISVTIEALQFFLMRGFSEVDDVMHNTLGCLIGFGLMIILRIIFKTRYNNV